MFRMTWITDPHFSFLTEESFAAFALQVQEANPDIVVFTGDIGESDNFSAYLRKFQEIIGCPVAFVLGNHDFYGSSWDTVRNAAVQEFPISGSIAYLGSGSFYSPQGSGITLVGVDGWYHAVGAGNRISLNDFQHIHFQNPTNRGYLFLEMKQRAQSEAELAIRVLNEAKARYPENPIYFLTHVPPFPGASLAPDGRMKSLEYRPFYTSDPMGEALSIWAADNPDADVTVLCGHSHTSASYIHFDNLRVRAGSSAYGEPEVSFTFQLDKS